MRETRDLVPNPATPAAEGRPTRVEAGQRWKSRSGSVYDLLPDGGTIRDGEPNSWNWSPLHRPFDGSVFHTYLGPAPAVPPEPRAGDRWRPALSTMSFTVGHFDGRFWREADRPSKGWLPSSFADGRLAFVDHGEPAGMPVMETDEGKPKFCLECGGAKAHRDHICVKCSPMFADYEKYHHGLLAAWRGGARDFPRPRPPSPAPAPEAPAEHPTVPQCSYDGVTWIKCTCRGAVHPHSRLTVGLTRRAAAPAPEAPPVDCFSGVKHEHAGNGRVYPCADPTGCKAPRDVLVPRPAPEAPKPKAPPLREVGAGGAWCDYEKLIDADPFESYPVRRVDGVVVAAVEVRGYGGMTWAQHVAKNELQRDCTDEKDEEAAERRRWMSPPLPASPRPRESVCLDGGMGIWSLRAGR